MTAVISSRRLSMSSAIALSTRARVSRELCDHESNASAAARAARSTSCAVPSGVEPICSSLAES
jgi:hypothetical protein